MSAETFLTDERIRRFLEGTEDGTLIVVTYRNANDLADKSPRTARGTLLRTPPTWTVTRSTTSRVSFHQNAKIISVTIPSTSRTISRDDPTSDPDESDEDTGVVEVQGSQPPHMTVHTQQTTNALPTVQTASTTRPRPDELLTQRLPAQPAPQYEAMHQMMLDFMEQQRQQQKAAFEQMMRTVTQQAVQAVQAAQAVQTAPAAAPARQAQVPGTELTSILTPILQDVLRGDETPIWRLAPGLQLPKYIPERFKIVSIPHLLFTEDVETMRMTRVPIGTAFPKYTAMRGDLKHQFPNLHAAQRRDSNQHPLAAISEAGVRATLERAEAIFADLLMALDNASDLPQTKDTWRVFINAGVSVLEAYATLANGFPKGGAKVAVSHTTAMQQGMFNPAKLWPNEQGNEPFRQ